MSISAGNKTAKALGIRFIESPKKKTLGFEVPFDIKDTDGTVYRMNWTGWLSSEAIKFTMSTMVDVLEYNGDDEVIQVPPGDRREGMLKNQDAINRAKDIQIVVDYEDYEGKSYAKIKYLNNVGGGQFAGVVPEVVKPRLEQVNFRAHFLAAKQGQPQQDSLPQQDAPTKNTDDIPF